MDNRTKVMIDEMVTRTMREGGFHGDTRVTNIRLRRDGSYSATVDAQMGGGIGKARYRALVKDGHIRVTRVSDVTVNWPSRTAA